MDAYDSTLSLFIIHRSVKVDFWSHYVGGNSDLLEPSAPYLDSQTITGRQGASFQLRGHKRQSSPSRGRSAMSFMERPGCVVAALCIASQSSESFISSEASSSVDGPAQECNGCPHRVPYATADARATALICLATCSSKAAAESKVAGSRPLSPHVPHRQGMNAVSKSLTWRCLRTCFLSVSMLCSSAGHRSQRHW